MRNIGRIFRDDVRLATSNIVSLLVVLGLCLIPALFAWVNIAANWNPHGNTGNLKVAVSNSDDGYESSLMPVRLNIGDRVVNLLRENDDYDWVFVDEREAVEGVRSGEYYAALTIPRDFSSSMMSVLSSDTEQVNIGYYLNMKENPVAPIIAGEGGSALEEDIRAKFTEAVDEMSLGLASDFVSFAGGNNSKEFGARLVAHLDDVAEDLDAAADRVRSFAGLAEATSSYASTSSEVLAGSEEVAGAVGKVTDEAAEGLDAAIGSAQSAANSVNQQVKAAKENGDLANVGTSAATQLASDVSTLASSIASVTERTRNLSASLDDAEKAISDSTDSVVNDLDSVRGQLNVVANKLNASSAKIRKFQDDVASAIAKGNLSDVATILEGDKLTLAQWIAEPVQIERQAVYPAENYGSSVAPFYIVLSIWVGAVALLVLMKTSVSRDRLRRYEEASGRPVKSYEQYLGRYLAFALLSLVQATIVGLGALFFLRIQCAHPLLLLAACWVCAFVFSNIAYTLAVSFGGVGKALCVILLVMQVVGAASVYPVQMMGDVFQVVQLFLPFTYGVHAMQSAAAGMYGSEYAFDLLRTVAFLLPSLLLGLALRGPIIRFNNFYNEKLEETGIM